MACAISTGGKVVVDKGVGLGVEIAVPCQGVANSLSTDGTGVVVDSEVESDDAVAAICIRGGHGVAYDGGVGVEIAMPC